MREEIAKRNAERNRKTNMGRECKEQMETITERTTQAKHRDIKPKEKSRKAKLQKQTLQNTEKTANKT